MSTKTGKKMGFWTALAMMVGSIVGIGIFFKSNGILRANDWNGISTLMSWIIGGVFSIAAAISFSEIGSMKVGSVSSLGAWGEKTIGKRFGYFTRFNYSFFYYGLYIPIMGIFSGEMLFKMLEMGGVYKDMNQSIPFYASALTGLGISFFFMWMNFFSTRAGGIFQTVTTILKWVPLILVAAVGLSLATTNFLNPKNRLAFDSEALISKERYGENAFNNGTTFSFTGMLAGVPAVLFAFDSFLNAANMRHKMSKPDQVPLVITVGILSTATLYFLIALAAILHGSGNVSGGPDANGSGIFDQVFKHDVATKMGIFTYVFLTISTFGVTNGMIASGNEMISQSIDNNTFFGAKSMKKKFSKNFTTMMILGIIVLFWWLVTAIPAIILDSDIFVDGVSNFPTVFFFAIYAIVIFSYLKKRDRMKTKKINDKLFKTMAWTAIIGIGIFIIYTMTYGFLISAIIDPENDIHWGLMHDRNHIAYAYYGAIYISVFMILFFMFPYLNKFLTKKYEDNEVIKNTFLKSEIE